MHRTQGNKKEELTHTLTYAISWTLSSGRAHTGMQGCATNTHTHTGVRDKILKKCKCCVCVCVCVCARALQMYSISNKINRSSNIKFYTSAAEFMQKDVKNELQAQSIPAELARSWLSPIDFFFFSFPSLFFFFFFKSTPRKNVALVKTFWQSLRAARGSEGREGGCLPLPSLSLCGFPSSFFSFFFFFFTSWQLMKHLVQLVYLDLISFSPNIFEQLPLNTRFTNISFKGTNKCVARLGRYWLVKHESVNLISECITVIRMGASGKCFFFFFFLTRITFWNKNKWQKDVAPHYKNANSKYNTYLII